MMSNFQEHVMPLDPTGSPLLQAPARDWLRVAESKPNHYGPDGLIALMRAHHQNCGDHI